MPAVTLRHIEIFHAVMTAGNDTEAAALLHTSQPTVSRELMVRTGSYCQRCRKPASVPPG